VTGQELDLVDGESDRDATEEQAAVGP